MKKSLFTENAKYTKDANKLDSIARTLGIEAAFKYAKDNNFSIRETGYIVRFAIIDLEIELLM